MNVTQDDKNDIMYSIPDQRAPNENPCTQNSNFFAANLSIALHIIARTLD